MLKRVGLKDHPYRTLQMVLLGSEVKGGRQILWVRPVRNDTIHLGASSRIPMWCSLLRSVWWDKMLNTAVWTRRIRATDSLMAQIGAVVGTEIGLGSINKVFRELLVNGLLEDFGEEREQRDGGDSSGVRWVQRRVH